VAPFGIMREINWLFKAQNEMADQMMSG
jgi:hypothetical protein